MGIIWVTKIIINSNRHLWICVRELNKRLLVEHIFRESVRYFITIIAIQMIPCWNDNQTDIWFSLKWPIWYLIRILSNVEPIIWSINTLYSQSLFSKWSFQPKNLTHCIFHVLRILTIQVFWKLCKQARNSNCKHNHQKRTKISYNLNNLKETIYLLISN